MKLNKLPSLVGFTLIEVMVTIAIVGILATLAIPTYDDYITRGQVIDALAITQGSKLIVQERVALGNRCIRPNPPAITEDIIVNGQGSRYVSTLVIEQGTASNNFSGCKISITFKGSGASAPLPKATLYGAQIELNYMLNSGSAASQTAGYWVCQADPRYAKYLPSSCTAS